MSTSRKVAPPDPSAQWLLSQFSEAAHHNKVLVSGMNQTRKQAASSELRSNHNARLRQALMLVTGCACDASLFLDVTTGQLISAFRINLMLKDLMQSYRMEHGAYGAFFKKVFRWMEDSMQKITSVYHGGVALLAIGSVVAAYLGFKRIIDKTELITDKSTLHSIAGILTFATATTPALSHTTAPWSAPRTIWFSTNKCLSSWRSAQLVSAVFQDGISASKLDKMKKISRELERLDQDIQALQLDGHAVSYVVLDKLKLFRSQTRSALNTVSFGAIQTRNTKVHTLFKDALVHPQKYTRAPFLKKLIAINGSHNVLAYHFLNSYGDRRNNVAEIIAAYLIMHEKVQYSTNVLKEAFIPKVANKTSINNAKHKQQHTRKSSLRKSPDRTIKKTSRIADEHRDTIREWIRTNTVVIFSKTYCPHCTQAKALIQKHYSDKNIKCIELDRIENGNTMQEALRILTKQTTVPNIFINQKHIGRYSDLLRLQSI